ncbi:MFS transporter [Nocardiopsis sp. ARC36]
MAGLGAGVLTAVATATAAAMVADRERGRAMALVTFGLSTGTVAGVPVGMLIGQWAGWRWTMGLVVAIGAVSMVAVLARRAPYPAIAVVRLGENLRLLGSPCSPRAWPWPSCSGWRAWACTPTWSHGGRARAGPVGVRPGVGVGHRRRRRLGPDRQAPGRLGVPEASSAVVAVLVLALGALALLDQAAVWVVAVALWGAAGWAGVPVLQHLLVRGRERQAMAVVAFQMAAMYLGSAVGAAWAAGCWTRARPPERSPAGRAASRSWHSCSPWPSPAEGPCRRPRGSGRGPAALSPRRRPTGAARTAGRCGERGGTVLPGTGSCPLFPFSGSSLHRGAWGVRSCRGGSAMAMRARRRRVGSGGEGDGRCEVLLGHERREAFGECRVDGVVGVRTEGQTQGRVGVAGGVVDDGGDPGRVAGEGAPSAVSRWRRISPTALSR